MNEYKINITTDTFDSKIETNKIVPSDYETLKAIYNGVTRDGTYFYYFFEDNKTMTEAPYFDTSKATTLSGLLAGCSAVTKIPIYDFSSATECYDMFYNCINLKEIAFKTVPKVTNCGYMFDDCISLETISQIDLDLVTSTNGMFDDCFVLKNIDLINLGANLNVSESPLLTHDSLMRVINGAKTVVGKTLTLGATNLAKLSTEEKAIATNKGWTLI